MPLVEPPGTVHRNPHQIHHIEHDPQRPDRALEHGSKRNVERETLLNHHLSCRGALPQCRPGTRSTSVQPVKRFSRFQSLSPCRSRISSCIKQSPLPNLTCLKSHDPENSAKSYDRDTEAQRVLLKGAIKDEFREPKYTVSRIGGSILFTRCVKDKIAKEREVSPAFSVGCLCG